MAKKVYIKPTPRKSTFKIHEFKNVNGKGEEGKSLNKTKISPNCHDSLQALYSKSLGHLKTGLEVLVENPYIGKTIKDPGFHKVFKLDNGEDKHEVKLQHVLEYKHGTTFDYYTNRPEIKGQPRTFMQDFKYSMIDGTNILDINNPMQELAYYMLKESKYVAGSLNEWLIKKKPYALYYIFDEQEEEIEKVTRIQITNKGKGNLESDLMSSEMKAKIITYLRNIDKDSKLKQGSLTDTQAYLELDTYIKTVKNSKTFNKVFEDFKTKPGKIRFEAIVLLQNLLDNRIVWEKQDTYYWSTPDTPSTTITLGERKEEVIAFLTNPAKQTEIDEMKAQLKNKQLV